MVKKSTVAALVFLFLISTVIAFASDHLMVLPPTKVPTAGVETRLSTTSQQNHMLIAAAAGATSKAKEAVRPKEEVKLQLLSMTMGASTYVLSFALAEIVNKNHAWLRIDAAETKGSVANLVTLANDPGIRKNTLVCINEEANSGARQGRAPFKSPYTGARAVASMAQTTLVFATLDKNMKTKGDADGKRIMTMQKSTATAAIHEMLFFDVWNIKPKMSYGDFNATKDALMDGVIDIGVQAINGVPGVGYTPNPALNELMISKNLYFLNFPAADVNAVAKKGNFAIYPHTIPARAIGDKQLTPVSGYSHSLSWWADESVSPDVIYEVVKVIYENSDKFQEYHKDGRMITKKTLGRIGIPDELFHPGALKFYKEKGINRGLD